MEQSFRITCERAKEIQSTLKNWTLISPDGFEKIPASEVLWYLWAHSQLYNLVYDWQEYSLLPFDIIIRKDN